MTEESTPYVLKMRKTTASASPKPKHEWIVILPDHENVLDKRMAVRPYDKSNLTLLSVGSLRKVGSTNVIYLLDWQSTYTIEPQISSERPGAQDRGWILDDGR